MQSNSTFSGAPLRSARRVWEAVSQADPGRSTENPGTTKIRCVVISWSTTLRYDSHMSNVSGRDFGFASWSYSYGQNCTLGEWAE